MALFSKPFQGGVHPQGFKELTNKQTIGKRLAVKRIFLTLQQRNGTVLQTKLAKGETVGKGQLVAYGSSDMAVPLHSPVNGYIEDICDHVSIHPSGLPSKTVVIRANDNPHWAAHYAAENVYALSADEMIDRVLQAGVVGLGGAGFPTGIKLRLARQKKVHTLLVNGGECEPYLTCDDRLMQENAAEIVLGVECMLKAVGAQQAIIAIEDNKPASINAIRNAADHLASVSVQMVPSVYPMGSERHLMQAVFGKTVKPGQLSADIGILVQNVATARAVYHAVRYRRPLVERVITVSGAGIERPQNIWVPIGTPVHEILTACGGLTMDCERLIAGGPMMGQVIPSPYAALDKSIGGLIAMTSAELRPTQQQDCVRCGRCVQACPMGLMPFQMAAHAGVEDLDGARNYGLDHCLLCGACAFVCPSHLPLVQHFQHARGKLNATRQMTQKSALTRQLADAKKQRLEREAQARQAAKAARVKRTKPVRRQTTTEGDS